LIFGILLLFNWPLLGYAGKGNIIPDFPLINKSFIFRIAVMICKILFVVKKKRFFIHNLLERKTFLKKHSLWNA